MAARILPLLMLVSTLTFAQDKSEHRIQGFVSGGYTYNVRENDHGLWGEVGGAYRRIELSGAFFRMADAPWNYHESQAIARFSLSKTFSIEGGHAWGVICNPNSTCGYYFNVRTHTPFVGVMYHTAISRRLEAVIRMDITTHWQLPPTKGKDDGLPRLFIGLRLR